MADNKKDGPSDFWSRAGRSLLAGGSFVKDHARDLFDSVDPDVKRHLLQLPLLSYSLLGSREERIEPGEPDGHPPLVFVHGLGGSRGDFMLMSWYMWFFGRKRSYRTHFEKDQGIDDMAGALARFIRKVKKVTGEPKVDIVSHSLGGVVSRIAVCEHRLGTSVGTLITLGSPLHGTWSARYASTVRTRELRPDSELIARTNRKPWPKSIRVFNYFSNNDLLIVPPESAFTPGSVVKDVSPTTHYGYLLDKEIWAQVKDSLD